jgi:hypothetical protein
VTAMFLAGARGDQDSRAARQSGARRGRMARNWRMRLRRVCPRRRTTDL